MQITLQASGHDKVPGQTVSFTNDVNCSHPIYKGTSPGIRVQILDVDGNVVSEATVRQVELERVARAFEEN